MSIAQEIELLVNTATAIQLKHRGKEETAAFREQIASIAVTVRTQFISKETIVSTLWSIIRDDELFFDMLSKITNVVIYRLKTDGLLEVALESMAYSLGLPDIKNCLYDHDVSSKLPSASTVLQLLTSNPIIFVLYLLIYNLETIE